MEQPGAVLSALQAAHSADQTTLVLQDELNCLIREVGGGACASAAGIDVLQALRLMARLEKLPNPHKVVLASFADQQELLTGRVSNDQFVRLMKFYEGHLDGAKLKVDVISALSSTYATDKRIWPASKGPSLETKPNQVKVFCFTVTENNGNARGRHFVLLKDRKNDILTVVDPDVISENSSIEQSGLSMLKSCHARRPANLLARLGTFSLTATSWVTAPVSRRHS